jgi:hypothetical protein
MAIVINANDGTISGVAVGGLPDGIVDAGTLATNSVDSAELIDGSIDTAHIATDQITSAILPAGSILQVVTATTSSNTQITSTTYTDTSLTANITPSSTSNKVLVLVSQNVQGQMSSNGEYTVRLQLLRDATSIQIVIPLSLSAGVGVSSTITMRSMGTMVQLDSPSTTSEITYKTQGKVTDLADSVTCRFQEGTTESSIVLMEIAG